MATQESLLHLTGMTCPSCVRHVEHAVRALAGVADVQVNLRHGDVRVRHDPSVASVAALVDAIRDAGYEARP